MNEYLAFQLYIQVFWKVVLVYSALSITVQCLSLLVIDIEETYVSIQWPQGLTGDAECLEMARSTCGSSSGSYGSLATQSAQNG